jgi:mono/diheme cytochrome c family protein
LRHNPGNFAILARAVRKLVFVLIAILIALLLLIGILDHWRTYSSAWRLVAGPRTRLLRNITFERTEARRARGEYLVEGPLACFRCHSERDWKQPGAPVIENTKGAGHEFSAEGIPNLVAPNITPDPETGAGNWTDDMLARAIREGIGHDGRALHPQMWYRDFHQLSDEDVASVVVYLRSIPPIRRPLPHTQLTVSQKFRFNSMPQPITVPQTDKTFADAKERGEHLEFVADCAGCHTDWYHPGSEVNGKLFAGGNAIPAPEGKMVYSANITPDPTGIAYKDPNIFVEVMRTGLVGGHVIHGVMPWWFYRNMSDEDLKGIFAWLQAQEPVKHVVDNTAQPTFCKRCQQVHGGGELN